MTPTDLQAIRERNEARRETLRLMCECAEDDHPGRECDWYINVGAALEHGPGNAIADIDALLAEIERLRAAQHPTYRCAKCDSRLFWSGKPGCVHRCLTCEITEPVGAHND